MSMGNTCVAEASKSNLGSKLSPLAWNTCKVNLGIHVKSSQQELHMVSTTTHEKNSSLKLNSEHTK